MIAYAERLACSGAGYVQDNRSAYIKAPPTNESVHSEASFLEDPMKFRAQIVRREDNS